MSTVTVKCPSCQASYQAPVERAGAHFKCKQCGETLTVPRSDPSTTRPVVMPTAPAAAAPKERPVVMPAKPAAATPPVVMPSKPAGPPPPPVVKPSSAAPPPQEPRPRPGARPGARPGRAQREPAPEAAAQETKPRTTLVLIILGCLALITVGGYFAWPKAPEDPKVPKSPETTTASPAPTQPKSDGFDAAKKIAEIKAATGADSAGQLWALIQKLDGEAKTWREKEAPSQAVEKLTEARDGFLEKLVELVPEHAGAREMRREVKYDKELEPFFDATYLSDSDRDLVRKNRLVVNMAASENGGWITKTSYDANVKPLVEKFSAAQAEAESRNASPFGRAAKVMENEVIADLTRLLGGKAAFRAFVHEPYVIFVEENPGWSPSGEATSLFSPLKAILQAFLKEFGGLGLAPLDKPVPVLYFKSEERYGDYNTAIGNPSKNVLAHYEPSTGRLALNRGVSHEVIIHEGTHQVFDKYTTNLVPHPKQSFWFQEGVAEWFGGSNRIQAKDGSWAYETGVLLDGRLDEWVHLEDSQYKLSELLDQTYAKRNEYLGRGPEGEKKIGLVYAQGWFLIYFLNHFNVDDQGMVQVGAKGKYADLWNEYLKSELTGKTGKKVFMECLKIDDAGLAKMEKEYLDYFKFVRRKRSLGQIQEKKLVAWDKYVNKKGVKTGEKADDLLIEQPRHQDKDK